MQLSFQKLNLRNYELIDSKKSVSMMTLDIFCLEYDLPNWIQHLVPTCMINTMGATSGWLIVPDPEKVPSLGRVRDTLLFVFSCFCCVFFSVVYLFFCFVYWHGVVSLLSTFALSYYFNICRLFCTNFCTENKKTH